MLLRLNVHYTNSHKHEKLSGLRSQRQDYSSQEGSSSAAIRDDFVPLVFSLQLVPFSGKKENFIVAISRRSEATQTLFRILLL